MCDCQNKQFADTKIQAALTYGFLITIKAFIPGKEKPDNLSGGIIYGAWRAYLALPQTICKLQK